MSLNYLKLSFFRTKNMYELEIKFAEMIGSIQEICKRVKQGITKFYIFDFCVVLYFFEKEIINLEVLGK